MRRAIVVSLLIGAIAAPAALAADPVPGDYKNAAKYCQAVRAAKGVQAFQAAYGTNKNKRNAFGKCVSATNKAKAKKADDEKADDDEKSDDGAGAKAVVDCKKQQAADAAKFAQKYKNLGQCVKAAHTSQSS
ncbi:MAG TPA: hypothetical protein VH620_02410 [Gaiella sp.]|jgi:hypothetical protein